MSKGTLYAPDGSIINTPEAVPTVDMEDEENFHILAVDHPEDPTKGIYQAVWFQPIFYTQEVDKLLDDEKEAERRMEFAKKAQEVINFKLKKIAKALR